MLEIDVQRAECCHAGGALEFDGDGNLYIATGDNTNPFASDGYAPIDERAGRAAWDAQRTVGQHQLPERQGAAHHARRPTAPTRSRPGNLFAPGTAKTRPEIYAHGLPQPVPHRAGRADGHAARRRLRPRRRAPPTPSRGPDGRVEWNILDQPGFYGWPLLRRRQHAVHRLRLRDRPVRRGVRLRGAGQRLARTTPV